MPEGAKSRTSTPERYRCYCGGWAYTRDAMLGMARDADAGEHMGWENYWRGTLSVGDMYCSTEDDVLTEPWTWVLMGLKLPVHDEDYGLLNDAVAAPWGDVELVGGLIW